MERVTREGFEREAPTEYIRKDERDRGRGGQSEKEEEFKKEMKSRETHGEEGREGIREKKGSRQITNER